MVDGPDLLVFVLASLALVAVPGPAVVYLVTLAVTEGRGAGARSAAGVALGNFGHAALAAFGAAAVFVSSPAAFRGLTLLGAGYLVFLGVRALLVRPIGRGGAASTGALSRAGSAGRRRSVFLHGALVGLTNPKVALFLLAFLPQFADPERGAMWAQLLGLGTLFVLIGWAGDSCWALAAGTIAKALSRGGGAPGWARWVSGGTYIALGAFVALGG